jgi:hypothetical protein
MGKMCLFPENQQQIHPQIELEHETKRMGCAGFWNQSNQVNLPFRFSNA